MKSLTDVMADDEGRSFLKTCNVFLSESEFCAQLRAPIQGDILDEIGGGQEYLLCSGQQLCTDYRQSVTSKLDTFKSLAVRSEIAPWFLWVDTDRSGSDNLMTKFAWPISTKKGPINIASPGSRDQESRWTMLDPAVLSQAMSKLDTLLRQSELAGPRAIDKFRRFRAFFEQESPGSLAQFNRRLSHFLFGEVLGCQPQDAVLSELLERSVLKQQMNRLLNRLGCAILAFNTGISDLLDRGIDPQLKPLPEDFLPLFYSCDKDNQRLRLSHIVDQGEHFAAGRCRCGEHYRFHLGRTDLSIDELAATGRWSPDVSFPILINPWVSGYVAGKSSALYLIVLNRIVSAALEQTPVLILVPQQLNSPADPTDPVDSLIYRYFAG